MVIFHIVGRFCIWAGHKAHDTKEKIVSIVPMKKYLTGVYQHEIGNCETFSASDVADQYIQKRAWK